MWMSHRFLMNDKFIIPICIDTTGQRCKIELTIREITGTSKYYLSPYDYMGKFLQLDPFSLFTDSP